MMFKELVSAIKVPLIIVNVLHHHKDYKGEALKVMMRRLHLNMRYTLQNADSYDEFFLGFLRRHMPMPAANALPQPEAVERKRVWVMWWQGAEQMPPLVKACYDSLRRHSRGMEVVLITKDNVADYIKIPDTIQRKLNEGKNTLAAFSDYVRVSLLSDYGGIWADSTLFFVRDMPDYVTDSQFFTFKGQKEIDGFYNVSHYGWSSQLLASNMTHCRVFEMMRQMWEVYWETFDSVIDYFMADYFMALIFPSDAAARQFLDSVAPNNRKLYALADNMNAPFDPALWQQMCQDEDCFKLSYRDEVIEGDTFYWRIVRARGEGAALTCRAS